MNDEFRSENLPKWENLLKEIFNGKIPETYEWTNKKEIIKILNKLAKSDTLNHVFLASSGGMDLVGASESHEEACIEIHFDGLTSVINPKKLMFESFPEGDYEWAYFRLVLDDLARTNTYDDDRYDYEILTELAPGEYVERSVFDDGYYKGRALSEEARVMGRILKGDLVIFNKASLYKSNPSTYDGRHGVLGIEGFRKHIKEVIKSFNDHADNE